MIKNKIILQPNTLNNSFSAPKKGEERSRAVSFQGKIGGADFFSMKLNYKELCKKDKFNEILNLLDPSYKEYFQEILLNLSREVDKNPHLFKDMPDSIKLSIKDGNIVGRARKSFMGRLLEAATDPVTSIVHAVKNKFSKDSNKKEEIKKAEQLGKDIANIEGLVEFVQNLKEKDPEKIKKLIQDKIKKNFTKIKASYSSNLSTTVADLAMFLVSVVYNAFDFYNLTRRVDDNHQEAMKEAKMKVKQDVIRLSMISYLTYIATTLLKKDCNKSMIRMLGVISVVQMIAEVVNRKVTGRPVLPMNEEKYKKYIEKHKNYSKIKSPEYTPQYKSFEQASNIENFAMNSKQTDKKISFTGASNLFSKEIKYSKNELKDLMELIEKIDSNQMKRYTEIIEKGFSGNLSGKKLSDIYSDGQINEVAIGREESGFKKFTNALFLPITAPIKLVKKLLTKESSKANEVIELKNYFKVVKNLLETKYKGKDLRNDAAAFAEFKKDIMNAALASFRTSEANYNTANYAVVKRVFIYTIYTTFIAADAYNVTMLHSEGNKKKAAVQAKQRIIQEITRFFISIYTNSANAILFSELYNKSLINVAGLTTATSTFNNYLTRTVLGKPILPKNKDQLNQFDEKRRQSKFYQFIDKLTGKKSEQS